MKTRRYKNGDYRAFKDWTDTQWEGLSKRDKAMWTEYSEEEPAPIPQEVINFTEENDLKPCCKEVDECKELRAKVVELESENANLKAQIAELNPELKDFTKVDELDEEAEKDLIKAKLTELGVPFRANTGLKKLKEKLEEYADNTE